MLTRAGRGHDGDGLGGRARLHGSVRGLGGSGARSSGRLGAGGVMSSSRGGARGGSGLGASRVMSGRMGGRVSGRGSAGGRPRRLGLALVAPFLNSRGRADVVSTTSLHDTSKGRAGKGEGSQSVDHFERLKDFFVLDEKRLAKFKRVRILQRDGEKKTVERAASWKFISLSKRNELMEVMTVMVLPW